jgi:hypothetical protein
MRPATAGAIAGFAWPAGGAAGLAWASNIAPPASGIKVSVPRTSSRRRLRMGNVLRDAVNDNRNHSGYGFNAAIVTVGTIFSLDHAF